MSVSTLAGSGQAEYVDAIGTAASFNGLAGLAVDSSSAHAYTADSGGHRIRKVAVATGAVSTLAGSGNAASVDGIGIKASFNGPSHLALDAAGSKLYVVESLGRRVRVVTIASGAVGTLAGSGASGGGDIIGLEATFTDLRGIGVDGAGSFVYVSDFGVNRVRKIAIATGAVSTVAGKLTGNADSNGNSAGYRDGAGTLAWFDGPRGLTIDATSTNIYLADSANFRIRKIVITTGTVSTIFGSGTKAAHADASGTSAQFNSPISLALDAFSGEYLYITDADRVRMASLTTGAVITVAGSSTSAWQDGVGTQSSFSGLQAIAIDGFGNIHVATSGDNRVRTLRVSVLCAAGYYCSGGGVARAPCSAGYNCPTGSNSSTQVLCQPTTYCPVASPAPTVCPVSSFCANTGMSMHVQCTQGSYCAVAGLSAPNGTCDSGYYCVTGSSTATQYLCSHGNHCPAGASAPIACLPGYFCPTGTTAQALCPAGSYCALKANTNATVSTVGNLSASLAGITGPFAIAADGSGSVFVSSIGSFQQSGGILRVNFAAGASDFLPGGGGIAEMGEIGGLVADSSGNLYATDATNNRVRRIVSATGAVVSVAGNGTASFADGFGTAASFSAPRGLAIDSVNQLIFVADTGNNMIRQISIGTWSVSTIAGRNRPAYADGVGTQAAFNQPTGIALLPAGGSGGGVLFVADTNNNCIRRLEITSGAVTTLVGSFVAGFADGLGSAAMFSKPFALASDALGGSLFVLESGSNRVRLVIVSTQNVQSLDTGSAIGADQPSLYVAFGGFDKPTKMKLCAASSASAALSSASSSECAAPEIDVPLNFANYVTFPGDTKVLSSGFEMRFQARASNDIHVAFFTEKQQRSEDAYEIVLGGWSNTKSAIRRGTAAAALVEALGAVCSPTEFRSFWVRLAGGVLSVGTGLVVGASALMAANVTQLPAAGVNVGSSLSGIAVTNNFRGATQLLVSDSGAMRQIRAIDGQFVDLVSLPCMAGYYCPAGSAVATQVACPTGTFHCPAGASAPVSIACAAGFVECKTRRMRYHLLNSPARKRSLQCIIVCVCVCVCVFLCLQARQCVWRDHVRKLHGGIFLRGRFDECVWWDPY
jgi:hypothetical protein